MTVLSKIITVIIDHKTALTAHQLEAAINNNDDVYTDLKTIESTIWRGVLDGRLKKGERVPCSHCTRKYNSYEATDHGKIYNAYITGIVK